MKRELPEISKISNARVLLNVGDSVTTDHISPAGAISRTSPAAKYLQERGLKPRDYNRCTQHYMQTAVAQFFVMTFFVMN